jgi:hypothetical protein
MTAYDFGTIHRTASHLSRKLEMLQKSMDAADWRWMAHRLDCAAIVRAMNILADTPKLRVSQKILAAFDSRLKDTQQMLAEWCDSLLSPDHGLKESELPY